MTNQRTQVPQSTTPQAPSDEDIAIHVLHHLTTQQMSADAPIRFDALRRRLQVRRMELVRVLGRLDRQGLIDASRLRTTLAGFAIGVSLRASDLPVLRPQNERQARAA